MKRFAFSPKSKQRGIAALFVAVILLIAVTLLVMFASRVALLDQRTSANEYRHSQAFAKAEAGLEQAAAFLRANPILHQPGVLAGWAECEAGDGFPCDDPAVRWVFGTKVGNIVASSVAQIPEVDMPGTTAFLVRTADNIVRGIGVGTSDDVTGVAVVEVAYGIANILSPGELPPLMAPTSDLGGSFTVVPNPNFGGPGVPVSIWTTNPNTGPGVGSWQTCDHGDFRDGGDVCMDVKGDGSSGVAKEWAGCKCEETRSTPTDPQADIVIYDENDFPDSPFTYVFGDPNTDTLVDLEPEIKAMAEASGLVLDDCSTLDTDFNALQGSALVWIEGELGCDIPANKVIGSREKPIILVIEGDTKINANAEVWGVVVGLGASVDLNGGPVIHGSVVAEIATDLTNGSYSQVYDENVFENLLDDSINTQLTKLSYSWRDFRP